MSGPRITILENIHDAGVQKMETFARVEWRVGLDRENSIREASDSDAIIIKSVTKVDDAFLNAVKNLRVIARAGSGTENIDLEAARRRGIQVITVPLGNVVSAAEFTIAMMLMLARNIPRAQTAVANGDFRRHLLTGHDLGALRVGLVGLGNVGKAVAARLAGFGCTVQAFDPHPGDVDDFLGRGGALLPSLDELLRTSDVVSLHVRQTAQTEKLIGREELALMPQDSILINTARGSVVDDQALLDALNSGHLSAAGVDVLSPEPPFDAAPGTSNYTHALLNHPKILVTPHMAASTIESQKTISLVLAKELHSALS